jgi:hypothetical protein
MFGFSCNPSCKVRLAQKGSFEVGIREGSSAYTRVGTVELKVPRV